MLAVLLSLPCFAAQIDDSEVYFADVHSYGYKLGEGIPVYVQEGEEFIHLELMLEFLEFPITEHEGHWQGWFINEENTFDLDVEGEIVGYPGHHNLSLAAGTIYQSDDGLVVDREALQAWFGIELELDLRQQVIHVRSQQALPFQQQLAQEAKIMRGSGYLEQEAGKPVADQYQWFTEPQVDFNSSAEHYDNGMVAGNSVFMSLSTSMDFLKHGMLYNGSFSSDQVTRFEPEISQPTTDPETDEDQYNFTGNHHLTFFRRADSETSSIFWGIDFYEFGDIFGAGNLIGSGGGGLGISIGRSQKNTQAALGKTNISGIAPANWLAELYRDGVLLDIGRVDPAGQYYFPDRDLNYGQNLFLVRMEGPQGEVLEHHYPVWGGGSELAAGEYNFDVLLIDHQRQVFDEVRGDHTALPATQTFESKFSYGLADQAEIGLAFTAIDRYVRLETENDDDSETVQPFELTQDQYLTLSAQKNIGIGSMSLDYVQQQAAGDTWKLIFLGKRGSHTIYFDHQMFNEFSSPANRGRENLAGLSEIKLESPLTWKGINHYSLGLVRKDFLDDRQNLELINRIGGNWDWLNLNNELIAQLNDQSESIQGKLRFATRFGNSSARGELAYAFGKEELFQRLAVDWTYRINPRLSNNLKVIQSLGSERDLSLKNRLTWKYPSVDFGLDLTWNDGGYSLGFSINTAFGFDRQAKRFFRSRSGLANTGKVAMQLFVDSNNNGALDQDEETLEDVQYRNEDLVSGKVGGLLLNRVPEMNVVSIKTDDLEFNDGYLVPVEPRYAIYTHAGSTVNLPIPVVLTGDIEGMVYRKDPAGNLTRRGKMNVQMELISANGRVTRTTRSQYDGYYSFVEVPIGLYQLRVIGSHADPELSWEIELDDDEGYVEVEDFYVF